MVNRIKQVMTHYGLSSTQFADQIGAQRSAMSHVLSGRNKPSLEFISKIKRSFPEIRLDWLILGTGSMLPSLSTEENRTQAQSKPLELSFNAPKSATESSNQAKPPTVSTTQRSKKREDFAQAKEVESLDKASPNVRPQTLPAPEAIIFYYPDGTFKSYKPR